MTTPWTRRAFLLGICAGTAAWAWAAAPIETITLERGCHGCSTGSRVVLQRGGELTYTVTGSARAGTRSQTTTGTLDPGEFDEMARFVEANGFFDMADRYEDPELRDGAWAILTIVRDGQGKQVFSREGAGPSALKAIESELDEIGARVRAVPSKGTAPPNAGSSRDRLGSEPG